MKLYPHNLFADAKEERRQGERAFTMVEIAIAIGVIGFALVAVIGILPTGMNAQKDNREDSTISQDAPIFMDAIRAGGNPTNAYINEGLDFLTNYVEKIMVVGVTNGIASTNGLLIYSNFNSGAEIVGLLSTPQGLYVGYSNYTITRMIVRSVSGAAVQQNGAHQETAFRYMMDVQIVPFVNVAPDSTNYLNPLYATGSPECLIRSNRWLEFNTAFLTNGSPYLQTAAGPLAFSCFDVKMRFSWPMIPGPNNTLIAGANHQTYRTTVASKIVQGANVKIGGAGGNNAQLWFFQPQSFTNYCTVLAL